MAEDTYAGPLHGWTCFHCGETFHATELARAHFGSDSTQKPACRLNRQEDGLALQLLHANDELERYRAEDSDKDRELCRMASEHGEALRREEEKGYARGLRDERERCLRIITRIKDGLRNGSAARNVCNAIARDVEECIDA